MREGGVKESGAAETTGAIWEHCLLLIRFDCFTCAAYMCITCFLLAAYHVTITSQIGMVDVCMPISFFLYDIYALWQQP